MARSLPLLSAVAEWSFPPPLFFLLLFFLLSFYYYYRYIAYCSSTLSLLNWSYYFWKFFSLPSWSFRDYFCLKYFLIVNTKYTISSRMVAPPIIISRVIELPLLPLMHWSDPWFEGSEQSIDAGSVGSIIYWFGLLNALPPPLFYIIGPWSFVVLLACSKRGLSHWGSMAGVQPSELSPLTWGMAWLMRTEAYWRSWLKDSE